jgi:mannitol/fructose-specific phosphotransferase system IIA component (Ntr-type)
MDSLLDALQEGRLIELPDNDKFHALQFLSHIIEAIPSVPGGTDVAGLVLMREESTNTALGHHFACPHARVPYDEDLICSIGWSPAGIDYGAPDNKPVHIVIMYLVPDNQRNHYLKEVSLLARALQSRKTDDTISRGTDLNFVRNYLLDLVNESKSIVGSETRARMIQLETRGGTVENKTLQLSNLIIEPVSIIYEPNAKPVVLTQNRELAEALEKPQLNNQFKESISGRGIYETNGWRIIKKGSSDYQMNRSLFDCIAVRALTNPVM